MIDKQIIARVVESALEGTDAFLVGVDVTPDNRVIVEIDSDTGVDIDTCARLTREIENAVDLTSKTMSSKSAQPASPLP